MFESLKRYKTTLLVLIVIGGAFWGYQNFFVGAPSDELLLRDDMGVDGTVLGQEIVQLLGELKRIDFNTGLFSDETFVNLTDRTQDIAPEFIGRTNPFDLIGVGIDIGGVVAEPTSITERILERAPEAIDIDIPINSETPAETDNEDEEVGTGNATSTPDETGDETAQDAPPETENNPDISLSTATSTTEDE